VLPSDEMDWDNTMSQELVFNLWAIFDANSGYIYGLSGKAYNISGTDSEKLSLLKVLSATDYVTAKRYEVPSRCQITFTDGSEIKGQVLPQAVHDPNAQLFEEVFRNLQSELPLLPDFSGSEYKAIEQQIPLNPLCVKTILYENESGSIRPIISDEDKQWLATQL